MDRQPSRQVKDLVQPSSLRATPLAESRPNWFRRVFGKKETPKPEPSSNTEFDRNKFTVEKGTGLMTEAKVQFNPELQAQYSTYLHNHLTRLADLYNRDPNAALFQAPEFRHQKILLETLAKKNNGNQYEISKADIDTALKDDPDLWITTTQIMEEDMAMTLAGLGLVAEVDPDKYGAKSAFDVTVDPQRIHFDINRGTLNKLTGNHPVLASLAVLGVGALSTPQGIALMQQGYSAAVARLPQIAQYVQKAGAIIQNPALMAPFAIQYAGLGASMLAVAAGQRSLFKEGVGLDIKRNADLLQRLKSGSYPAETQYLQDIIGLDINDLNLSRLGMPPGKRTVKHAGTNPNSIAMEQIQASLVSQMWTRFKFYNEGLGVPPEKINMISENLTFGQTRGNVRGELTVWGEEMQQVRTRKTAEFRNRTGGDPNPNEQMMIDIESRREIITRRLEKRLLTQEASEKTVSMLDAQADAVQTGESKGRIIEQKVKGFTESKTLLSSSNTAIDAVQKEIKSYQEKLDEYRKALGEAQTGFGTTNIEELNEILRNRNTVDDEALRSVKEALRTAQDELKRAEPQGIYLDSKVASAKALLTQLTGIDAALGVGAVGLGRAELATLPMEEIFSRVNEAYRRSVAAGIAPPLGWNINNNSDLSLRERIMFTVAEARAAESEPAVGAPSRDFIAWTGAGVGVSENFLRSATLDTAIAELQRRAALPPVITPADRARVEGVLREVQNAYNSRQQKIKEVLSQEPSQRQQYNNRMEDERTEIESLKTRIQTHNTELIPLEASRDQLRRNPRQIAETYIDQNLTDYRDGLSALARIHTDAAGRAGYAGELDPALLHTRSLQDILNGIHTAHAAGSPLAWDNTGDSDPDHIRNILSARAEAQAADAIGTDLTVDNADLADLLTYSLSEREIRTLPEDQLLKRARSRGGWPNTPASRTRIQNAVEQAKLRFDTRRNLFTNNLSEALTEARVGRIPTFAEADLAVLSKNQDFLNLTSEITRKLSVIRTIHPLLAGVTDSAAVLGFINRLEAEKRTMRNLEDMSGNIQGILTQLNEYDKALDEYVSSREDAKSKGNGAGSVSELDDELKRRAQHPNSELEAVIAKIKDSKAEISPSSETTKMAKERIDGATQSLTEIRRMNTDFLFATGRTILAPADLTTGSVDNLMERINFMHTESKRTGIRPPIGWPKEENEDTDHIETVSKAVTAARAESKITRIVATIPPALSPHFIATNAWYNEYTFLSLSPQELLQEATRRGYALNQAEAQSILEIRKNIFDAFPESTGEAKTANDNRVKELDKQIKNTEREYEDTRGFILTVKDMAQKQSEIYARIPDLIGAAYDAQFTVPVHAGNRFYTDKETNPTINGTRIPDLPKGYFDILHMLTGYQDNITDGRDVAFQKLINVSQFHPTAVAIELNRQLDFGLGAAGPITIDRVLAEIQRQVNNRTLNQSDIFHAVRGMKENYIAHVKAIS